MDRSVIFYLACNEWAGLKQREQHLCEALSTMYEVYYCEIKPIAKKSLAFLMKKSHEIREKEVKDNLTILQIPCVLSSEQLQKYFPARLWNDQHMRQTINNVINRYKGDSLPIIGVGHPRYPFQLLDACVKYFDCMDNMPAFYGDKWMLRRYQEIEQNADVILISSKEMYELFPSREDLVLVQNGVNPDDFAGPSTRIPSDMPKGKPIVGYYGTISSWFDFETVKTAARHCRGFNFVLIGPVHCEESVFSDFLREPNIFWLGQKSYSELKNYLVFFNIAIIPFLLNDLTRFVNPTKLYEYFCLGKPVLATPLPPLMQYKSYIKIYSSAQEFISALEVLNSQPPDAKQLQMVARANTWQYRARQIDQALRKVIHHRRV